MKNQDYSAIAALVLTRTCQQKAVLQFIASMLDRGNNEFSAWQIERYCRMSHHGASNCCAYLRRQGILSWVSGRSRFPNQYSLDYQRMTQLVREQTGF